MLLWVALACKDEPQPEIGSATCEGTDHPLRLRCTLPEPAAATWTVREGDVVLRTFTTSEQEVVLWGLPPSTELAWEVSTEAGGASGTVSTGAVSAGVGALRFETQGQAVAADHVMMPYRCQGETGVVVYGTDGRVKWYESVAVLPPSDQVFAASAGITSAEWLPGDEIAMTIDGQRVARLAATGEWRFDVGGFEWPLHHDVAAIGEHTYALRARLQDELVVDGLYVLDAQGSTVATWDLADHFALTGTGGGSFWQDWWPGSRDWGHANGLSAEDGHLLLSLRMHDAVVRLVADPNSPDFGEIDWTLVGQPGGELQSDFTWVTGGGFEGQHHPAPLSGGGLSVFDNGDGQDISRALFLDLDVVAGQISARAAWPVGQHCAIQGGAYELPGGGALVTCNDVSSVYEFVPGETQPAWMGTLSCAGNPPGRIDRARPVFLD